MQIPIENNSSISNFLSQLTIYQLQNNLKINQTLILLFIESLDCFKNSDLSLILKTFESLITYIDDDISLKLLQTLPSLILPNIEAFDIISSIFSISVSLIDNKSHIVSTSAFAATQQMITFLFENTYSTNFSSKFSFTSNNLSFTNPIIAISYLLLTDFANLTQNKHSSFIRVPHITAINELWDTILISNHQFIEQYDFLLEIIKSTIQLPITSSNISLLCTAVRCFSHKFPKLATTIITEAISATDPPKDNHLILVFLRVIFIRKPFLCFLLDLETTNKLLQFLDKICDSNQKRPPLNLNLNPIPLFNLLKHKDHSLFARTFSIEFPIVLLHAYTSMSDCNSGDQMKFTYLTGNHITKLKSTVIKDYDVQQSIKCLWIPIFTLLLKGIRLCDIQSSELVFHAYNILFSKSSQYNIDECSSVLLRVLCSIVAKQQLTRPNQLSIEDISNELLHSNTEGLNFKKKRALSYQVLLTLLYNHPTFFTKFYQRLFLSIGMYKMAKIDPNFTIKLESKELIKMCDVLSKGTPFCINFLKDVLIVNKNRFSVIWSSISPNISDLFLNEDSIDDTLKLLQDICIQCFDESILSIISNSITKMDVKHRLVLFNLIRGILGHSSNKIEKNWNEVLTVVHPSNCLSDSDLLNSAFASLNIICNDHLKNLTEEEMQSCISSLFEFAAQQIDINISLSSLGLLWVITPFINHISKFWKMILSEMLVFFNDNRNDVATCALRTFFSLLSSNMEQMPNDIYDLLITSCFIPILMTFSSFMPELWSVQQLALLEMCHSAVALWGKFESSPHFISNFWTLLIEKQQSFMMNCKSQEINVNALQFYVEAFKCQKIEAHLREELLVSFTNVISHFILNEPNNSLVISNLGHFFIKHVPAQKQFMNKKQLELWISSVEIMAISINSSKFVNMTTQKVINSIVQLLPFNNELDHLVIQMLVRICVKTTSQFLKTEISNILAKVISEKMKDQIDCTYECLCLFQFPEMSSFLEFVFKSEFTITNNNYQKYFAIYNEIIHNSTYGSKAKKSIIKVLSYVDQEKQSNFINENQNDAELMIDLWSLFCNPYVESFNSKFSRNFSSAILQKIFSQLSQNNSETIVIILIFIEKMENFYQKVIAGEIHIQKVSNLSEIEKWNIYGVVPYLIPLVNHSNSNVQKITKGILTKISNDLKSFR